MVIIIYFIVMNDVINGVFEYWMVWFCVDNIVGNRL